MSIVARFGRHLIDAPDADESSPRIAVVRLDNLGDHVLGSGLFRALRRQHPKSRITVLVPLALVGLYARCPFVDQVVAIPARETYLRDAEHLDELRRHLAIFNHFDFVINPRFAEDYYVAGLICQSIAAPAAQVVGFRQVTSPLPEYNPNSFFTVLLDASDELHVSRYVDVLARHLAPGYGATEPEIWCAAGDIEALLSRYRISPGQYVVVGCGASFPYKRPALDVYQHLVAQLADIRSQPVVLIGTEADRRVADALTSPNGARITSTVGELRLYELGALLRHARLYVGPDSGPMHMAAAAGTPVIELAWVPADYPARSRGSLPGGRCWAPWSARAISVRPSNAVFAARARTAGWMNEPIDGLSLDQLNEALTELLRQ